MLSRLKSLELHGYKTFASRTEFEFPGDITAIVGPNGSGKSNIADALRWVLGEQSYSLLRGRKTEDMIFSGSEQRPRASMASASITFDNEDGWLPIDYSEVSLARRAYRDGQNEYVLNGQRVRLKEISELLAQSGLAERTYTIIGQGLVDAALALKPEERNRFFEEAAGIGLYRSRREEAINRLDSTRRNLERVLDILTELEPRLKSLEKQAARAIEYDRIKAELQMLLREWYGYHWHRMQADVLHAREVLQAQESKHSDARRRFEEVDAQVRELRDQLGQVRGRLNAWHAQSAELHSRREEVNRALAVLDERQRALMNQGSTLQLDLARVEEEEHLHRERLAAMESERERLQAEFGEAETQAENARSTLAEREASRGRLEKTIRELRRQLVENETRQVHLKAHLNELKSRLAMLRKNTESAEAAIQPAEEKLGAAKSRLDEVQAASEAAESRRHTLETDLRELQAKIGSAEAERKQAQDELIKLSSEKTRLSADVDVLEQAESTLSGLNQGSKSVLQAAKQGKLTGSYRSLSQLIDVPAEYEAAITAALGDSLEGIALQDSTDPEAALEYLSGGEHGRATLYPQSWLRTDPVLKSPKDADCLGVAAQLVRAQTEYQRVIDLLLGRVLVARDRKGARRLAAAQPLDVRVVTLQGEIFSGTGAVTAGQVNRSALLAHPRQLREAKEALSLLDERLTKAEVRAKEAAGAADRLREAVGAKEKELREQDQQVRQIARNLQQATLEYEQARQKRDWQQSQLVSFRDQIQKSETESAENKRELGKIEGEAESFDLQIGEVQRSLDQLPISDFQAQVVHWNTQTALAERSLKDADRRLADYRQALQTNLDQQKTFHQRLEQVQAAQKQHDEERAGQQLKETELNAAIEELRGQIAPEEAELSQLEARYDRQQGDLSAAQQAVSVAERYMTQAQLESGRLRDSLDSLRRRIEEDFGLVAFEYSEDIAGPTPLPQ